MFEPTIPANEWSQTQALDCAATGIGWQILLQAENNYSKIKYILMIFPEADETFLSPAEYTHGTH